MSDQSKKGRSILFVASLVINLFLIGLIVGVVGVGRNMHGNFDGARGARPPKAFVSPRHLIHEAPVEARRQMFKILRENWDDVRPQLESVHAEREKIYKIMGAEELDTAALQEAISRLAEAEKQAHLVSSETIIQMLQLLPAEDRQSVIDALVRHERGRHDRRHKRGDRFDRPFERNMEDVSGEPESNVKESD